MRIRVVEVEGTPQELAESQRLLEVLQVGAHSAGLSQLDDDLSSSLPREAKALLDKRGAGGATRNAMESLLKEIMGWGDVDLRIGQSRTKRAGTTDNIRMHRRGSSVGAFLYLSVTGGGVKFRLPVDHDLTGKTFAVRRRVKAGVPYGISTRISAQALGEAIQLAHDAYLRTMAT